MIDRYTKPQMKRIWSDEYHWECCLQVERSWLQVKGDAGEIPAEVPGLVGQHAEIRLARILELENELGHDYNAFLDSIREVLTEKGVGWCGDHLHQPLTTMDGQDPAFMLRLREAGQHVVQAMKGLVAVLHEKAWQHQWSVCMGVTHNQDAEPTTLGVVLIRYCHQVHRAIAKLEYIINDDLSVGKMSGPVGTYGGMDPALEDRALGLLGLSVADDATQIIQRDRHARLMCELGVIAGIIEQIAKGLWSRMGSRVRELEEPRSKKKKDSSAMPGKKNPNLDEQMWGMARLVRGYVGVALENIATFQDRDISQSSPERVIFPDATSVVHYMLVRMTGIITGLVVHVDRMKDYVEEGSLGIWAGRPARIALVKAGLSEEQAYRLVQAAAHKAVDERIHLREALIREAGDSINMVGILEVANCFDATDFIRHGVEAIFARSKSIEWK